MKRLCISFLIFALFGCSHANNTNKEESEKLIGEILKARSIAISDDINKSRRLYISAYENADKKSAINNELLIYAVNKTDSLFGSYEMNNENFENEVKNNKDIDIEGIDGLCILNKFLKKYSNTTDMEKFPQSLQEDMNKALSLQPIYLEKLSGSKDYLDQLKCLTLK